MEEAAELAGAALVFGTGVGDVLLLGGAHIQAPGGGALCEVEAGAGVFVAFPLARGGSGGSLCHDNFGGSNHGSFKVFFRSLLGSSGNAGSGLLVPCSPAETS